MNASDDTSGKRLAILSVATEWESRHGGLSTFNRELCRAITSLGHDVFCLIPNALPSEVESAAAVGVTIVTAVDDPGLSEEMRLSTYYQLPGNRRPDVIIGHGRVTGPVAKVLAGLHEGSAHVHFIHVAPGAIEWFKEQSTEATSRAEDREQLEVSLAKSASLVAAVGPLLVREFGILLNGIRRDLFEFRPGLDIRPVVDNPRGIQCLILGRAEDESLKGLDIAARSFALLPETGVPRPILMVRGAPKGTGDSLRRRMLELGGVPGVHIRVREYSPRAERIADDLAQSSVLLMPSRSEGFGLVGLEGISAGVPVLLSDRSGLAELLVELAPDLAGVHVVRVTGDLEIDGPVWARRLDRILRNRPLAVRQVLALRDRLVPLMSWRESAERMLLALPSEPSPIGSPKRVPRKVIPLPNLEHSGLSAVVGEVQVGFSDLRVGDIGTVRSWGWDDVRLHTELYKLDYEMMEGLTDDHSGLVEQWGPVFADHPESWRILYLHPGAIAGYWHFVPLFDDQYREARAGRLRDVTITADRVQTFELPGIYDIYFAGLCLRPEFRRPRNMRILLHSILEVLYSLSKEGVFVGEICANAFTPGGMALSKSLGMRSCGRHADHGEVYVAWLVDLLDLQVAQPFSELRDLYRNRLRRHHSA